MITHQKEMLEKLIQNIPDKIDTFIFYSKIIFRSKNSEMSSKYFIMLNNLKFQLLKF